MTSDPQLMALRTSLVSGLRVRLSSHQGLEAFERHQLLTIRFHRAARLNAPDEGERSGWRLYFNEHFPRGGQHATLLWEKWRNPLVKDEFPGPGVAISHGNPAGHWRLTTENVLYVNLESMWDDFEQSVDSLIGLLEREPGRRAATIDRWFRRQWSVQAVTFAPEPWRPTAAASASASGT